MKSNELRIGNIVNQSKEGVSQISGYQIYNLTIMENGGNVAEYYKNFSPVNINEYWLTCFGFKKKPALFYVYDNIELRYDGNVDLWQVWDDSSFLRSIEYVHQLQNLYYSIREKELDIDEYIN